MGMKWRIFCVGKPALAYAKLGVEEYLKRLGRYTACEIIHLKTADPSERDRRMGKAREGTLRLVLDERGRALTTAAFAEKTREWQVRGTRGVDCFIGGADGHDDSFRQSADLVLGLSAFTLQHELALLVWLEQLYRVHTFLQGEPYHRE